MYHKIESYLHQKSANWTLPLDSLIFYLVKCAFIPAGIYNLLMYLLKNYRVISSFLMVFPQPFVRNDI